MSYTEFEISEPALSEITEDTAEFKVTVKNTGEREGSETLQLYVGYENSCVERPERELKDFKRVYLAPGEEASVILSVKKKDLAYYGENGFIEENINYIAYIGNCEKASRENKLIFSYK